MNPSITLTTSDGVVRVMKIPSDITAFEAASLAVLLSSLTWRLGQRWNTQNDVCDTAWKEAVDFGLERLFTK